MNPTLMTLVLIAAFSVFGYTIYTKLATLARLAPEKRLDQIGKRIERLLRIGFGQSRLVVRKRERASGAMHAFIFWGALLVGGREVMIMGEGFVHGFQEYIPLLGSDSIGAYLYIFVYDLFEVIVTLMVGFALFRRYVTKPARLDLNFEGVMVLWFIMGIMVTDIVFEAARFNMIKVYGHQLHYMQHPVFGEEATWAPMASLLAAGMASWGEGINAMFYQFGFWGHVAVMFTFLNIVPYTKQFHEITALPNVFLGSVDTPHAPIQLLDCEDEAAWENESLGVNKIEQLTWKQGLDLLTCTECGRCFDICPTYVTGKPLTMKWVNDSLRLHLNEEARNLRTTGASSGEKTLVGDVISHDTLWACTTCRACEEVCPVNIEHVPRIISMRQGQTLMAEAQPEELNNTFKGLERNGNPWGLGYDQRADWAKEEDITILTEPPKDDVDVIMWVGCMGSFDNRSQKVAKATATLMKKAGVKFAILGNAEKCTGDLARRSGNEMLYQMLAQENVENLNNLQVKKIVTQCPHCMNSLKNEYPQLDGRYEVFHHSQYIAGLVNEGRLTLEPSQQGTVTYHDPCYLGRYNGEYDAPRDLVGKTACNPPVEMRRSGNEAFCCGAGGARMWMEESIGTRVNEERLRQAQEVGADTIATGCPFCMTMIGDGAKSTGQEDKVQVLDIAELVLQSLADKKG